MAGGDGGVGSSNVTPINSSNIGFKLLKKHGWKEGTGIGVSEQGRLEPVETYLKKDKGGVGANELVDATAVRKEDMSTNIKIRNADIWYIHRASIPSVSSSVSEELEMKKRKMMEGGAVPESMIFCSICNIACNSQAVYIAHLSGKKHAAQVLELTNATSGYDLMASNNESAFIAGAAENTEMNKGEVIDMQEARRMLMESQSAIPGDIETKKRKIVESGAVESDIRVCVICNVVCNSPAVFNTHLAGRKHAAQVLEIHNVSNGSAPAPALEGVVNNIEAEVEDIESKKRKFLEEGGLESDIRVCTRCNVVCNSPAVFSFHLGGQKHAAMLKKQAHS